uniref:Uncharacterized protein AlNc14C13G1550 n=1 Tax=Albugo laibachii Nc14 TaxID=890382 RepID=F0W3I8_9STRA|nr:conserved hypothetical protein [Albugo laibachii Nc14]CCA16309.1 conserved hypothetical protein [Albugo laibachii Nc14]|eukprot:CCA16309.1 conserved hypothetical protein [Albugo laibachii Nc14]
MGAAVTKPLCLVTGLTYPAYASFKALDKYQSKTDQQWLTYWAVYGICTSFETISSKTFRKLPGFYVAKFLFLLWLMLPKTRGAMKMYNSILYPIFKTYEPKVDRKLLEIQIGAEEFVNEYKTCGTEAVTRRLQRIQQSEVVTKISAAIASPLSSPIVQKHISAAKDAMRRHKQSLNELPTSRESTKSSKSVDLNAAEVEEARDPLPVM